ncbi:MAG TPA: universal stress protein [Acidimicrobiales bacterium]|nr:universal stress protein [Acidimicrobiales bacterium]
MGRIVVGVDETRVAKDALVWALAEARLRRSTLEVISCYHASTAWLGLEDSVGAGVPSDFTQDDLADPTRQRLAATVAEVAGPDPGVEIVPRAVRGRPADVLVEASQGADLLVVGSGTHGELARLLLSSPGRHTVDHAHCPVVVVRGDRHPAAPPDADRTR